MFWFRPWVDYLVSLGVQFRFGQRLHRLQGDARAISAGELESGERIEADIHVLAINPFATAAILDRTPALAQLDPLRCFRPLVRDGPHTQVSFRIAFSEPIRWPRPRCGLVIADSEFNLTVFAQEQAWRGSDLGDGIAALWTATACVSTVPGRVHGRPLERCTREQFLDEVRSQLFGCGALDELVRAANGGRALADFPIRQIEIWHEWTFDPDGIIPRQPKWVTTTHTQPWQPDQRTPIPNLALAGAHTRTAADVWSIEAAVESGRRAVRIFAPDVEVLPQYRPWLLRAFGAADDALYRVGAPHILQVLPVLLGIALVLMLAFALID